MNNDNLHNDEKPTPRERLLIRRAFVKQELPEPNVDKAWEELSGKLEDQPKKGRSTKQWLGIVLRVAAIVLLIIVLWPKKGPSQQDGQVFVANDAPKEVTVEHKGECVAVAQKVVALDMRKTVKGQPSPVTVTTSRGKSVEVLLPDGSKVWLNAESKITFPERFVGSERKVEVKGEAYFEVKHDAAHPFIVATPFFETRVLGTSFDLRAYSPTDASVVLVEGKVTLEVGEDNITLQPNHRASLDEEGKCSVAEVDIYPLIQWKDGYFYFDNSTLREVMLEMGRWYNVNIVFENPARMNLRLHFVAERDASLPTLLKQLNNLKIAECSMEGNAIVIK